MATSTNYGWAEPDNSSLVKNGAADIRTLGDAIDTSLWNVGFGQAGKNKIINGDYAINQRSFTSTTTSGTYGFDRWALGAVDGTTTYSAQTFTVGTAPVAGYEGKNFARVVTTGQTLPSAASHLLQRIESSRTFAGQTVTYSFWAKAATGTPKVAIEFTRNYGTGGSPTAQERIYFGQVTLSTSWARYSLTASIPSLSGKTLGTDNDGFLSPFFWVSAGSDYNARLGSLGIQSNTFDFWGAQAEYGSKMTPFQLAGGGDPQSELAMCQRYFWREYGGTNSPTIPVSYTVNSATIGGNNPVTMRTAPSITSTYINANYGTTWGFSQPTRAACTKTGSVSENYFGTPNTWAICYDGGTFTPTPTGFQGSASSYFQASAEL
jgi:hypothetical protein